ncbi:unnamed protein product [Gadus morhua 'NCC']
MWTPLAPPTCPVRLLPHVQSHSEQLRILSVHGKGEGPLALDGHDTLFTASKREALNSLSADHSVVKSLERGEQLVRREELTMQQQTPDTILIKDEEVIGGGMPAVDCDDFGDCSTQHGATLDNLHAPGSSHMSSHNRVLRILSVYGNGEGPLTGDDHDNHFTSFKPEALSSLPAVHSVGKSLERGEQLVHHEELTGHRAAARTSPTHMRTHSGEKPYRPVGTPCPSPMDLPDDNAAMVTHLSPSAHADLLSLIRWAGPVADDVEEGDLAWCAAGLESLQSVTWDHVREAMSSSVDMRTVEEKAADSFRESSAGMPVAIRGFHQYREDITSADGVVLCKDRCVFGRPIRDFIPIAPGRYRDVPKMATPPHEPLGKQLRGTEAVSFSNGHSLG